MKTIPMKTVLTAVTMLLLGATLHAQEAIQPTVGNGGFIAMLASPTRMNGEAALLVGGGLCGVFEHRLRLGVAGAGLVNEVRGKGGTAASRRSLTFGYGGIYGEYVLNPENHFHFSVYALAGGGGLLYNGSVEEPVSVAKTGGIDVQFEIDRTTDAFFIAEPGMNVEVGLAKDIRMSAGAGYRFIHGVATDGVSNATLSGPVATLMMRFGVF